MKLLVLCSVLIIYLLNPTSGLKCYECDDFTEGQSCKSPKIISCGAGTSQTYCGKASFTGIEEPFKYCNGNCSDKGCLALQGEHMCGPSNTFEIPKGPDGKSGTAFCCQGDLCNNSYKLSNQMNVLFCSVVFSCFYSLVG